jgi:hypothetical protein
MSPESLHHEIMKRRMELATKQEKWNVGQIRERYARAFREWMANREKGPIEHVLYQHAAIDVGILSSEIGERVAESYVDAGRV